MLRTARSVRRLSSAAFVMMAGLVGAGIGAGLQSHDLGGYGAVCASPLARLTGAVSPLQSVSERFHNGACISYEGQATALMSALLTGGVLMLVAGLLARAWARQLPETP